MIKKLQKDDTVYLRHMIGEIEEIKKDMAKGDPDSTVRRAVVRSIEVIGEAARNISDGFKQQHPHIPWRKMVGMRNLLIHGYFDIDYEEVWQTVEEDLPQLEKDLTAILEKKE